MLTRQVATRAVMRRRRVSESSVSFADFAMPLVRRRRFIFWFVVIVAVVAIVASLLWPQSWRASVTLLPPERRMDNPLFIPGGFEAIGASLRGITLRHVATPTDVFIAILESRNVAEALIDRFDLMDDYDTSKLEKAVKRLRKDTLIETTRDGMVRVSAIANSPQKAADLTNGYVEELDRVNRTLAFREATAIREFIERELDEAKVRLAAAEESLRTFQERFGAIHMPEQAKAVIAAAAQLQAQILAAEVELGVLKRTRDDSHPEVIAAQDLVSELRRRLEEIEGTRETELTTESPREVRELSGTADSPGGDEGTEGEAEPVPEVFPPLSKVPELGLHYKRLYREVETEDAIVTLLTEQYHRARIEERRSLPTVRVLDTAKAPERRWWPRRSLIVIVATAAAFVLAVILAYLFEIVARVRENPEKYAGLHEAARELRKGLRT
jgi:tyrosine-protein kinase Etk/Wzc